MLHSFQEYIKDNVALFWRLYIGKTQRRWYGKLFQTWKSVLPPLLSEYGKLRFSKKSDLLNIISLKSKKDSTSSFDSIVIDGAALVHLLPVKNVSIFDDGLCAPYTEAIATIY